jgi:hypothetical protein
MGVIAAIQASAVGIGVHTSWPGSIASFIRGHWVRSGQVGVVCGYYGASVKAVGGRDGMRRAYCIAIRSVFLRGESTLASWIQVRQTQGR